MERGSARRGERQERPTPKVPAPAQRCVPPNDLTAEQAVLGGCLTRPKQAEDILEGLRPELFYSAAHQAIAQAVLAMLADGTPLDLVTLADRLRLLGTLDAAGGLVYLAELADVPGSPANARQHAGVVRVMAQRRAMLEIAAQLQDVALSAASDPKEFAAQAQETIDQVLEDRVNVPSQRPKQVAAEAYDYLDRLCNGQGQGDLLKTPLYDLNKITGGFAPGETVVIGGRPGTGKTAIALGMGTYALDKGAPGGIFSLEMRSRQLALRMFASKGKVNAQRFRDLEMTPDDWGKIGAGAEWLARQDDKLRMWDRPGLTPQELRAQIRKWKREIGVRWIIVDYLQRMRADRRCNSREQEVAEISRGLKEAALEYDVALICLAQLNREAEKTQKPMLSQLRESGAVEADADIILFLTPWDTRTEGDVVEIEVDVAKSRSSRTGSFKVFYQRSFLRFVNPQHTRKGEEV